MHRDPVRRPYPDGGYLAHLGPHSGEAILPPTPHPEVGQNRDQNVLEPPDVLHDGGPIAKVANRVTDQLPGAVVGDVASPIYPVDLGTHRRGSFG